MTSIEHIASISYGKDSIAMLEAIKLLNYPLDRIVTAEIWATDTIQADVPPMVEFKAKADKIILERYGIKVEHFTATKYYGIEKDKVTYADCFYNTRKKGKHTGVIYGFPMVKGNWCTGLKLAAINAACCDDAVQYIGIAADEPKRIERHKQKKNVRMPLVDIGWDEAYCRQWCEKHDLLSPIYQTGARGGAGSAIIKVLASFACFAKHTRSYGQKCSNGILIPRLFFTRTDTQYTISINGLSLKSKDSSRAISVGI